LDAGRHLARAPTRQARGSPGPGSAAAPTSRRSPRCGGRSADSPAVAGGVRGSERGVARFHAGGGCCDLAPGPSGAVVTSAPPACPKPPLPEPLRSRRPGGPPLPCLVGRGQPQREQRRPSPWPGALRQGPPRGVSVGGCCWEVPGARSPGAGAKKGFWNSHETRQDTACFMRRGEGGACIDNSYPHHAQMSRVGLSSV
jgi:hypothetical protein